MSVAATPARRSGRQLEAETRASRAVLSATAERLSELVPEATEWDEHVAVVLQREREIETRAASVAEAQARAAARISELDERERTLAEEWTALAAQAAKLVSRETLAAQTEAELHERRRALEARAARFHWRWFLRVWAWRPRPLSKKARLCEFFFVPTPQGYKLLEQAGVAVTPQARLTGLLDQQTSYSVTKLAQLPFDGRWCAYLELNDWRRTYG